MKFGVAAALLFFIQVITARPATTPIGQLRKQQIKDKHRSSLLRRDVDPTILYPAYNLSVPVDHFHNESEYAPHSNEKFNLRYWFDASYYQEGGPVVVLESGEADGTERLPYLQKGIVAQLIKATGGLGVILEHRYYGTSIPTPDLSTKNLRFLTTEQAMADVAYFVQNVEFQGVNKTLTAPETPYIMYGGSYAGAFVAFLRVKYPQLFWGAISSSGVTKAIYDYWEYYEPIREFAPPDCILATQQLTNVVDNILLGSKSLSQIAELKTTFGLGSVTDNRDFANLLSFGIGNWQGRNWDPDVNDPSFFYYCQNLTAADALYPTTLPLTLKVKDITDAGGYEDNEALQTQMLNWIGYVNLTVVSTCEGETQDECFTNLNATFYEQDGIDQQSWRSWSYQYCTQWGYIQTGSGVPHNILPLISRTLDLNYLTTVCRDAFNITNPPDVEAVNKYGGFDIHYPRLAIIGGQADPWRPATPLADKAGKRKSTTSQPVLEIPDAVHHWDENGLFPNETTPTLPPNAIVYAQQFEKDFVLEWMKEWNDQ